MLKRLPKAENIVEFDIPEVEEEAERELVLDAEEYERIEAQKREVEESERLRTRSEVLKRDLPRMGSIPSQIYYYKKSPGLQMIE